ncbi:MAG: transketolase C-terminal domain-containing protein, partial [Propionicimonas sp.]
TFLNRAFDQVLMDVALHRLGVTFVLDRAGVTGPDGPSHNGMWDLSLLGVVPGLRLAAPRDEERLAEALQLAVTIDDGPTVLRFSKERLPAPLPAVGRIGGLDVLFASPTPRVLVVGYGQLCGLAVEVGERLAQQGIGARVVDPVWALPVSPDLIRLVGEHELVITIEDGGLAGGLGSRLSQEARAAGIDTPLREFGIPQDFLPQGNRAELLEAIGLSAQRIAREVTELFASQLRQAQPARSPKP